MQFDKEPYQLLLSWTIAFALVEPLVALLNYGRYRMFGIPTIYQIHAKTSPFLVVISEYLYFTIVFVKTMYFYKLIFKKPTYYPRKDNKDDYRDFIICFLVVQFIVDLLWAISIKIITAHIPFLGFLNNYSRKLGIYAFIRPLIYGCILLGTTEAVHRHFGDLEGIATILFSLFAITMASF